jgi:Serine carboxypeptidase
MEEYLKLPQVLEAFHVRSVFFEVDNAEGDFDYTPTEPDLQPFYKEMNGKLKVLVYNGDTDPAITSFATQNWTSHLGFDESQHWRPWTIDHCQQMGGYVTRYEGKFDVLTIRGAGHMVVSTEGLCMRCCGASRSRLIISSHSLLPKANV